MRLRKVIVSGFKSFLDPTTISLPSDLIGIVGPNGCGKSNVIDAVRWVMGESSARHLRGDSMADVIFNGSNARKPVGQAQVELVFDNSDGRLGDRYAAYTDISVKRQVTRDGNSQYSLNGTRCRRRDITDLFLGTGLGPRSYAIIEQGMISRLIEARPEELRDYLEEVAGISRYKERRRETENRMRHTREHLERLTDVREELARQLQRLERQAKQAERYKLLKAEEREVEGQLLALRWRALDGLVGKRNQEVRQAMTAVEAAVAALRATETDLERNRELERTATEAANDAYRVVLQASSSVARTEEAINSLKRQSNQLQEMLTREQHMLDQARARLGSDEQQLGDLEDNLREGEPALEGLEQTMSGARERYAEHERRMHDWQARWQELANQAQEPSQAAHAERGRIDALEDRLQQAAERRTRIGHERDGIDIAGLDAQARTTLSEREVAQVAEAAAATALTDERAAVAEYREQAQQAQTALHEARARLQQLEGTKASLEALQRDALGASDNAATTWLAKHELTNAPRLAERLSVASGWETAVEAALGQALEAVVVAELGEAEMRDLARLADAAVTLVTDSAGAHTSAGAPAVDGTALTDLVSGPQVLKNLLAGVVVASSDESAIAQRASLAQGQRIVTQSGLIVAGDWARNTPTQTTDGVLARAQQLRDVESELKTHAATLTELENTVVATGGALEQAERQLAGRQEAANEAHRTYVGADAKATSAAREAEQARKRFGVLGAELEQLEAQKATAETDLGAARARLSEATSSLQDIEANRQHWNESRDEHRQNLENARNEWQRVRDEGYQLGLRVEAWRTRIKALQESRGRNTEEVERLMARVAEVEAERSQQGAPLASAEAELQTLLQSHREAERGQSVARDKVREVEAALRALSQKRNESQAAVDTSRAVLNQKQLAEQETQVRRETVREQLAAAEQAPEAILAALAEKASDEDAEEPGEEAWAQRLEELGRRIHRLGAINLAAIEEHTEASERKEYLDAQHADLEEALETLEAAIKRIDRETRARFKETFEKVNQGLSERFPKLFGGGRAHLQLTGEDVLDSGVSVMAQPPGKRNSSIQLLSGGEKALTAVALVFAMFDLNPAPFCLLDEVDAPLDDANVSRFSELVREMAEQVQMLVVTHNKVTMEVMQQLIGVTMHEPGVSRLVAVDIDDAVAMVDT